MTPADETTEALRAQLLSTFAAEVTEYAGLLEGALLALERTPDDPDLVDRAFRAAHTLKGNAAVVDATAMMQFAHALEAVLDAIRERRRQVDPPTVDLMLDAVDLLERFSRAVQQGGGEVPEAEELQARLLAAAGGPVGAPAREGGPRARAHDAPAERPSVRVDLATLDRLLDLAGELSTTRLRMTDALTRARAAGALELHAEADRLQDELQQVVLQLRMVPIGPVLRPLQRVVRDLSRAVGKQARLTIEGEDAAIDAAMAGRLRDPLLHLLRNAIDHGIEVPADREAAGKPACGQLVIKAWHGGGALWIELGDDGAGYRLDRIAQRARARGHDPAAMTEEELLELVFEPGFSTAEKVTEVSGRGVGMDVVRTTVQALRGTVRIESTPGKGSRTRLQFPLTLAMIHGFGFRVGAERYVLPLEQVEECLPYSEELFADAESQAVINVRGEPVPLLHVGRALHLEARDGRHRSVLIVRGDRGRAGLLVDALLGDAPVVVKPLGVLFPRGAELAGSTILADGQVAFLLDAPLLVRRALQRGARSPNPSAQSTWSSP